MAANTIIPVGRIETIVDEASYRVSVRTEVFGLIELTMVSADGVAVDDEVFVLSFPDGKAFAMVQNLGGLGSDFLENVICKNLVVG